MTSVHPLPRFNTVKRSTRKRLTQRACRKVSLDAVNGVITKDSWQTNKETMDAGFCGEPFADSGELLSSLSPLLFSMKLLGLYFHREDRRRRRTDDPEWRNPVTATSTSEH